MKIKDRGPVPGKASRMTADVTTEMEWHRDFCRLKPANGAGNQHLNN